MRVVVAYDVSEDRARARLAAVLCEVGIRLQRSVFECEVSAEQLEGIVERARELLDLNHDVMHVFRQCGPCGDAAVEIGQAPPDLDARYWIVSGGRAVDDRAFAQFRRGGALGLEAADSCAAL